MAFIHDSDAQAARYRAAAFEAADPVLRRGYLSLAAKAAKATNTPTGDLTVFRSITKSAPQSDGSLLVSGKCTGPDLDLDEQRMDPEWLKKAMPEWFGGGPGGSGGNIREQHDSKRAVGKAIEHRVDPDGSHFITARIVDPIAKAKVQSGVLTGFSVGIKGARIEKSTDAPNGVLTGGKIVEISLVDRPCLPSAVFDVAKAAGYRWAA
jgi:hypothetical protein